MDLKGFYRKLNELESTIATKDVYVVSNATPDGGKEGVVTHVPRRLGCQLVVEGKARLATAVEIAEFEAEQLERRAEIEKQAFAGRIQVQVVTDSSGRMGKSPTPVQG